MRGKINNRNNNNRENTNEQISFTKHHEKDNNNVKDKIKMFNNKNENTKKPYNSNNNNNNHRHEINKNNQNHSQQFNNNKNFFNKNKNNNHNNERTCSYCKVHFPANANSHYTNQCYRRSNNQNNSNSRNHVNMLRHHDEEFAEQIGCIQVCNMNSDSNSNTDQDNNIYYDTCATIGVIKDINLLTNVEEIQPMQISGVGGQTILAKHRGILHPFSWQLYSPDAKFNILSHNVINEKFYIEYLNKEKVFLMHNKKNKNEIYKFTKTPIGLFKFDGGYELPPRHQYPVPILRRDTIPTRINNNSDNNLSNNQIVNTSKHIINNVPYTTKQIEQFNKALQLHARMNHINDAALGKLLDNGSILNINVTSDDLKTARSLWGPCTSCLIGKMTSPVQSISPNLKVREIGELLHSDIYYVNQQTYLLCIDDRTGFMNLLSWTVNLQNKFLLRYKK